MLFCDHEIWVAVASQMVVSLVAVCHSAVYQMVVSPAVAFQNVAIFLVVAFLIVAVVPYSRFESDFCAYSCVF